MVEINKSLDGTLEKAISASAQLKKMPGLLQDFMLLGDFNIGKAKQVKASDLHIDNTKKTYKTDDPAIQNLAAQLAGLDKSQQNAVFKMSDLSKEAQNATRSVLEETAAQKSLSGSLIEGALRAEGFTEEQAKIVLQNADLIDSADNYLVVDKKTAQQNLETALSHQDVAAALKNTSQTEKQLAASIVTTVEGQQVQTGVTWLQTIATNALTGALAIAKQAAIAFGIGLLTLAGSKALEYLMNLKTRSEELVDATNDSHNAAWQAVQKYEQSPLTDAVPSAGFLLVVWICFFRDGFSPTPAAPPAVFRCGTSVLLRPGWSDVPRSFGERPPSPPGRSGCRRRQTVPVSGCANGADVPVPSRDTARRASPRMPLGSPLPPAAALR